MTIQDGPTDWESPSGSRWFERLSPSRAPRFRFFCFPYAGGSADVYRNWQQWFPEQLDICLVHLPGRGKNMGKRAFSSLVPLVAEIADHITLLTDIPYALYGHSMGALISFELARELSRRQEKGPERLFVSGCRAPQCPIDEPFLFKLPGNAFLDALKKLNGTPKEVFENPELMELVIDLLRADFEVVETYQYRPEQPLSCPIIVYGGTEDGHVPAEACHQWQKQTTASCTVRMFPGDHFFVRNAGLEFGNAFRRDVLSAVSSTPMGTI
ncbi:MAG TPA: alpha/beta fold hydrolase [Candidatus Angelobacter sp.]